ncbi:acyl-CoA thioesterase II [Rhodococcus ruber]|uniref:acyl-CoA thioesterase n=1 Tax=Rhodococcus ruber TaxID=1830 RepID=UPI000E6AE6AB|nr:acyl-CoA thioesterase II [Rhodococcus ruber]AXY50475.1 acyl-CoA thioesterase [Rhodococcus ruber]UQB73659.1 acyl-CoA thioesterase II [Rhodococcus ruber]
MPSIDEILRLREIAPATFRAAPVPTEMERTFGGQVAGQALAAAARTVPQEFGVHSVHGHFLRPGRPLEPADYHVDAVRDGGSFRTRYVTAVQDGETVFTLTASFHRGDDGHTHQAAMPPTTGPEEVTENGRPWAAWYDFPEWDDWERRWLPADEATPDAPARRRLWIRHRSPLPDDPVLHACALTYCSDMALLDIAVLPHPERPIQGASLDHAVWFLRPFRVDEWLLFDQVSPSSDSGRALIQGQIFDTTGRLVAVVAQEGMVRFHVERGAAVGAGRAEGRGR